MKSIITFVFLLPVMLYGQNPWTYNFGTGTGTFNTANTISTTFLPQPTSGEDLVRVGTTGGQFVLQNPGSSLGSATELRIQAPTSASINKFSIYNYTASKVASIKFDVIFGNAAGNGNANSGTAYFILGDGATYSNASGFSGAETFTGLRFTYGASTVSVDYRNGNAWSTTNLSTTSLSQASVHTIEIAANNSTSTVSYNYNSVAQTVAANRVDIFIDGTLAGNDLNKAQLGNDANIDSWMFYIESSTGNVANLFLDDIEYANNITAGNLPVTLSKFLAEATAVSTLLTFSTATEINNAYFSIERSADRARYTEIGRVTGAGTSTELNEYTYTDEQPLPGVNYYRLRQVDFDGQFAYSPVVSVVFGGTDARLRIAPSPASDDVTVQLTQPTAEPISWEVYDQSGRMVLQGTAGSEIEQFGFNVGALAEGFYILRVLNGREVMTERFQKR